MSRITITRRHTGRYYVGMDQEAFFALYGRLLLIEGIAKIPMIGRAFTDAPSVKHFQRVVSAFKTHAAKIKAAAAAATT